MFGSKTEKIAFWPRASTTARAWSAYVGKRSPASDRRNVHDIAEAEQNPYELVVEVTPDGQYGRNDPEHHEQGGQQAERASPIERAERDRSAIDPFGQEQRRDQES